MKKTITILFVLAACLSLSAKLSSPVEQFLLGHVNSAVYMSVSINEDVLPFSIDSPVVKSQETGSAPTAVNGLKIGTYSLVTNDTGFKVTITHDKLVLFNGDNTSGKATELEYRLYMFTKDQNFKSCLSTGSIVLTGSDFAFDSTGMLATANRALYLSIAESDTSNHAVGDYESYITIHVEEGPKS